MDVLGPEDQFPAPRSAHREWWQRHSAYFADVVKQSFPPGMYGNGFLSYPPDDSPDGLQAWVHLWEEVFANKSILLIGHPFAQLASKGDAFQVLYGNIGRRSWSESTSTSHTAALEVAAGLGAPFGRARQVLLLRDGYLPLLNVRRWFAVRDMVLSVVDAVHVDLVAVAWGPQGKAIVADVACRGVQAIDIGRLLWNIHGHELLSRG